MSGELALLSGRRVVVDGELLYAYAESSGYALSDIMRRFNAAPARQDTCKMEYHTRLLSWKCSACGRMTRGYEDARMNHCPHCGARNGA